MTQILQTTIPYDPLNARKLPGVQPLAPEDWIQRDEAYAAQIVERERLLAARQNEVLRLHPAALPAATELLELVLAAGETVQDGTVVRPDGSRVALDWDDPLACLGRIAQQDFCILEKPPESAEHVLTGAVLCFPASWTLAEKFMRPLTAIHGPVDSYDAGIAARVQRLFDGVQPGRPLWRFNALWYTDPMLFQPRSERAPRSQDDPSQAGFLRTERQAILRLPRTGAVVFSIHTRIVTRADVMRQWGQGEAASAIGL